MNLVDRVRAAVDDLDMLAPDRKTTVTCPDELFVQADAGLLSQVMENLISNALKFGEPGSSIGIDLDVRGGQACLSVANTGPTIREQDREKIFERFYRVDESRSRAVEGAGLGLSLSREIARAHGGELLLESSERGITVFTLTLPLGTYG